MPSRFFPMRAALACAACLFAVPADAADCVPTLRAALNVGTHGAPLVTLSINGGAAHLLLDTGAEKTTLTEAAARRLGLLADFDHAQTMKGVGGNVRAGEVRPDLVTAGGRKLPEIAFAVVPTALPPVGEEEVDGLLGADMLGAYDIDLDIGHHLVRLYDPAACPTPALPWRREYAEVSAHLSRHRHVAFPVTLDGHKLTAFIDTGAQLTLLDRDAVADLGVSDAALGRDRSVLMQGVSRQIVAAREHRFERLGMADAVLLGPVVAVMPLRLDDADLLMGADLLMRERIWLSYATQRIFVALPE